MQQSIRARVVDQPQPITRRDMLKHTAAAVAVAAVPAAGAVATQPKPSKKPRELPFVDQALVLAWRLSCECDALHEAHPDGCDCTLCYDAWGHQIYVDRFFGDVANSIVYRYWEAWPIHDKITALLDAEVGDSRDPGSVEEWDGDPADLPPHFDLPLVVTIDPPAARKILALIRALDRTLTKVRGGHREDAECGICFDCRAMQFLLESFEARVDGVLHVRPKEERRLVDKILALFRGNWQASAAKVTKLHRDEVGRLAAELDGE